METALRRPRSAKEKPQTVQRVKPEPNELYPIPIGQLAWLEIIVNFHVYGKVVRPWDAAGNDKVTVTKWQAIAKNMRTKVALEKGINPCWDQTN